jgi:hypothetical protein
MSTEHFFRRSEQMTFDLLKQSTDIFPLAFFSQGDRIVVKNEDIQKVPGYEGDLVLFLRDSDADAACFAFLELHPQSQRIMGAAGFRMKVSGDELVGTVTFFQLTQFGRRSSAVASFVRSGSNITYHIEPATRPVSDELWNSLNAAIKATAP